MMDSRRWQSPAAAAAAAEAAEEDTGGAGGPSRRPARRGVHRASPYGYGGGPRRWLPSPPVASRIFPSMLRDGAPAGDSPSLPSLSRASAAGCCPVFRRGFQNGGNLRRFAYSATEFVTIGGIGSPWLAFVHEIGVVLSRVKG